MVGHILLSGCRSVLSLVRLIGRSLALPLNGGATGVSLEGIRRRNFYSVTHQRCVRVSSDSHGAKYGIRSTGYIYWTGLVTGRLVAPGSGAVEKL